MVITNSLPVPITNNVQSVLFAITDNVQSVLFVITDNHQLQSFVITNHNLILLIVICITQQPNIFKPDVHYLFTIISLSRLFQKILRTDCRALSAAAWPHLLQ